MTRTRSIWTDGWACTPVVSTTPRRTRRGSHATQVFGYRTATGWLGPVWVVRQVRPGASHRCPKMKPGTLTPSFEWAAPKLRRSARGDARRVTRTRQEGRAHYPHGWALRHTPTYSGDFARYPVASSDAPPLGSQRIGLVTAG